MMNDQFQRCQVPVGGTLRDAMLAIDHGACEIALVVDAAGRLVGVMTDGDIRRAFLHRSAAMDSLLEPFMKRDYRFARLQSSRVEILDLMQALTIHQIPVIDESGRLLGLHLLSQMLVLFSALTPLSSWQGGKGTRLRPITEHLPKPMILVAGRPILERLVLHVVSFGIRTIYLSINYLGHMVEDHFGDGSRFGCRIEYLREDCPLGTGGALSLLPCAQQHPLLVLNGDVVTQADLGAMIHHHESNGLQATMGVREYTHTVPFGCVEVERGLISELEEKPTLRKLINTGIYVLSPTVMDRVPKGEDFPITHLFDDCLRRKEAVGAFVVEDDWIDVGQKEQLQQARRGRA